MQFMSVLAMPLGVAMHWLYTLVQNYGWTIIIFTFLVRILMFPLSLKQQKSTARMAAYQPMIQEIQKKWANDRNKQNAEVQKFYEENNIKMSAGCLPMAVNMLVLFGIIAVIQAPLNYILQVQPAEINTGVAIVQKLDPESDIAGQEYTRQSYLIGEIKNNAEQFLSPTEIPFVNDVPYVLASGESYQNGQIVRDGKVVQESAALETASMEAADVQNVKDFQFQFLGLNLADAPTVDRWYTLIMPILSILTMVASQLLIMKVSPSPQGKGQMLMMTVLFGVMFGFFAFRVPAGFSLYYTVSNVVQTLQQFLVKRVYDPAKIREEVDAEIAARRTAKKAKKKVVVLDEATGETIDKELNESELTRLRLEKARQQDAKKYADDEGGQDSASTAKARRADEKKYGGADAFAPSGNDAEDAGEQAPGDTDGAGEATAGAAADETAAQAPEAATEQAAYKPGRRKRARKNKEQQEAPSFADIEKADEEKQGLGEKEDAGDA